MKKFESIKPENTKMKIPKNLSIALKRYEFWRNERLSRRALEAKQLRKFQRLVAFAKERSPYYARIIKERAIDIKTCRPEDFPVLTKNDLMENFDQIVTDRRITKTAISNFLNDSKNPMELFLDEIYATHTSGSSDEVGIFVFSKKDWIRGMSQIARNQPAPNPFKRKKIAYFGKTNGHYAGISWLSIIREGNYKKYFDLLPIDINTPLNQVIEQLNKFQPNSIHGYVTSTKILAEKQREGVLRISPSEISVGGEVLNDRDRAQIEEIFGCPVMNLYSCAEHMWMGSSIKGKSIIKLREDDLIFEIHDDHTIISNLFNFTLPLIRYRMADMLTPGRGKTTPGPYMEINNIIGRMENTPKFINHNGVEDFISHFAIADLLLIPGIKRFQIQLTDKTSFKLMVCLDTSISPQQQTDAVTYLQKKLKEILEQKLMNNIRFEIFVVADLSIDPVSGKFPLILNAA